ncbi:MAG: hypothetical protein LH650_06750, partial [Chloroflexi bacterium]|nr:hypothetical protein [Chloroflexota bacterium]
MPKRTAPRADDESWLPLLVSVMGVIGFGGLVALVRRRRSDALDLVITMKLQTVRHPTLERAMAVVSWFGFPIQSRVIPPVLIGAQWLSHRRLEAAMQLLAWGTALLSAIIKTFMRRPRPV